MTTSGQAGALIAGRYRLERLTGGGTWPEEIWQGFDEVLNRPVMMRLLPLEDAVEPDLDEQVQSVVAQVARLGHPNIAQVYDVGHEDALRYVVSEWTGGRTLGQIMATGRQPWQRAADWGQQISEALAALHKIGLVDGVLGPETVSVLDDRRVKLTDVGLGVPQNATATRRAAPDSGAEEPTQLFRPDGEDAAGGADDATRVVPPPGAGDEDETRLVPPPGADDATRLVNPSGADQDETRLVPPAGPDAEATRMVPGAARGALPEGAAADVYALGAILWTAIVGVPPQVGPADVQGPDVAPLRETGAPAALARLLKQMLAASAAVRPPASAAAGGFAGMALEAREVRDTVPTTVGAQPTQGLGTPPPPPPGARRYREEEPEEPSHRGRTTGIVVGVVLLLAAAGVAVGLVLANRNDNNPGPVSTVSGVPLASTGAVSFPANPASTTAAPTSAAPSSASAPSTSSAPHTTSAPPPSSASASPSSAPSTSSAPTTPNAPPASTSSSPAEQQS